MERTEKLKLEMEKESYFRKWLKSDGVMLSEKEIKEAKDNSERVRKEIFLEE